MDDKGQVTSENKGFNTHEIIGIFEVSKAQMIQDVLELAIANQIIKANT